MFNQIYFENVPPHFLESVFQVRQFGASVDRWDLPTKMTIKMVNKITLPYKLSQYCQKPTNNLV